MGGTQKRIRIGDLLVQNQLISEQQLGTALQQQKQSGTKLGRTLIDMGLVNEVDLLKLLSEQLSVPFISLLDFDFKPEITQKLPEIIARRYRALALTEENGALLVGMSDPTDLFAIDEISHAVNQAVNVAVVRETEILESIDALYRRTDEIESLALELSDELSDSTPDFYMDEEDDDTPVVKLLQSIFEDADQVRASDIHIEPDDKVLRIRQRVDGVLQEHVMNEKRINEALVLRLKLMSGLNISEKRLPQDGRFSVAVKNKMLDVRLSTLPTQHGEAVVMRLLDQSAGAIELSEVGMPDDIRKRFTQEIHRPHGLILVTGPTGSGKTTTLYGALRELNTEKRKIITVEDPVEYSLPRINQVQVHEKIGLDFGKVLRACLRQDPDVLLVGEIRDHETAEIALRASMTGHLVLSTLHTNDAISSAMRLIDVGVEGYLVASALRAIVAQRLVRRVCQVCATDYRPDAQEKNWLRHLSLGTEDHIYKHAKGCSSCNRTGYKGRIGVFEFLEIDEALSNALRSMDTVAFGKAAQQQPGYRPLTQSALAYAQQGLTSLDEVFRVSEQLANEPHHDSPHDSTEHEGLSLE